jgi:G1/S-specific cyclin PLC1
LYFHFDPFLAPIRSEIQREEERVRAKESRKRAITEQQAQEEAAARHRYEAAQYWIPDYEEKHSVVYQDPYVDSTRSRYDSPPSAADIPDLSRSATYDAYSTSSSASSYVENMSREGTPSSSIGSYMEEEVVCNGARAYSTSPRRSQHDLVHIASQHSGKHSMLPYEIERSPYDQEKPAKKPRRGGNIFSRFLGKEAQYAS